MGFALSYGPSIWDLHPSYYEKMCQMNSNIPTKSQPLQYIDHCPKDPLYDSTLISQTVVRLLSLISLFEMSWLSPVACFFVVVRFCSFRKIDPQKTNMIMEKQPFADVSAMKNGDVPLPIMDISFKWWVFPPHFTPQVLIIFSRKTHVLLGETHHFGTPPHGHTGTFPPPRKAGWPPSSLVKHSLHSTSSGTAMAAFFTKHCGTWSPNSEIHNLVCMYMYFYMYIYIYMIFICIYIYIFTYKYIYHSIRCIIHKFQTQKAKWWNFQNHKLNLPNFCTEKGKLSSKPLFLVPSWFSGGYCLINLGNEKCEKERHFVGKDHLFFCCYIWSNKMCSCVLVAEHITNHIHLCFP